MQTFYSSTLTLRVATCWLILASLVYVFQRIISVRCVDNREINKQYVYCIDGAMVSHNFNKETAHRQEESEREKESDKERGRKREREMEKNTKKQNKQNQNNKFPFLFRLINQIIGAQHSKIEADTVRAEQQSTDVFFLVLVFISSCMLVSFSIKPATGPICQLFLVCMILVLLKDFFYFFFISLFRCCLNGRDGGEG